MDKTNSKVLTLSFASLGALTGLTVHLLMKSFAAAFGVVARFSDSDLVRHGLPVVLGFLVFAVLQFNPKVLVWGDEVASEIRKVHWASGKDVRAMTVVVIIMVAISSLIISFFDLVAGMFLKWIMG